MSPTTRWPPSTRRSSPRSTAEPGQKLSASALLSRYRTAFVQGDLAGMLGCFAYPVQAISVSIEGTSITTLERPRWSDALQGLAGAYARLGVAEAHELERSEHDVIADASLVRVHWRLLRSDGSAVYDFHAAYLVVDGDADGRIASVTHDEGPKLRHAMQRLVA